MIEYTNEQITDNFLDHIRYLKIAHHVAGRIRIKATLHGALKLTSMGIDPEDIIKLTTKIPGINKYRLNKKALSIIIEYNSDILPFSLWEEIAALSKYPAHRPQVKSKMVDILKGYQHTA